MIKINRGPEPKELIDLRNTHLHRIRQLGREPTSKEIYGYEAIGKILWTAQHHKCCYCEQKITKDYNDVEHYRPKTTADRSPGCMLKHGYWWLAYTWENLLFACPSCNRSNKKSLFPLDSGSISLHAETSPPDREIPLLIDPASINPIEHIQFIYKNNSWWAQPRNGSLLGNKSIVVYGLNSSDLIELRQDYYEMTLTPQINALDQAIDHDNIKILSYEFKRTLAMLNPRNPYVGFSYDVLTSKINNLKKITGLLKEKWPSPNQIT